MKPAQFEYFAPSSVDEAFALLVEHGDEAKVLAGGQSLVPLMNMRLARPSVIVDLNEISELSFLDLEGEKLRIGAMTRQGVVERSARCRERAPLLHEAIGFIGHAAIRSRGTVGGVIAHADPAAELPAVVLALGADMVVKGPQGKRTIAARDFFQGYLTTSLAADEILTEIRIPPWPEQSGWSFTEISRRHGDFAIVGVACVVEADANNVCTGARLVLTGVGGTPYVSEVGTQFLFGKALEDEVLDEAQHVVSGDPDLQPEADIHASALYRKEVAGVMAKRALRSARARLSRSAD